MEENYKTYLDNGIYDIQDGKYICAIDNINKSLELKNDWEIPYFTGLWLIKHLNSMMKL